MATHAEVRKIIYLRQKYLLSAAAKIAKYLRRYHEMTIRLSTVRRVLKRLELNRLPASPRHGPHDELSCCGVVNRSACGGSTSGWGSPPSLRRGVTRGGR